MLFLYFPPDGWSYPEANNLSLSLALTQIPHTGITYLCQLISLAPPTAPIVRIGAVFYKQ